MIEVAYHDVLFCQVQLAAFHNRCQPVDLSQVNPTAGLKHRSPITSERVLDLTKHMKSLSKRHVQYLPRSIASVPSHLKLPHPVFHWLILS